MARPRMEDLGLPPAYDTIMQGTVPPYQRHRDFGAFEPNKLLDQIRAKFDRIHTGLRSGHGTRPSQAVFYHRLTLLTADCVRELRRAASFEPTAAYVYLSGIAQGVRRRTHQPGMDVAIRLEPYNQQEFAQDCVKLCLELCWRMGADYHADAVRIRLNAADLGETCIAHQSIDRNLYFIMQIAFRDRPLLLMQSIAMQLGSLRIVFNSINSDQSYEYLFDSEDWLRTTVEEMREAEAGQAAA